MDNLGFKNWGNSPIMSGQDRYDKYDTDNDGIMSPQGDASYYGATRRRKEDVQTSYSSEFDYSNFASPNSDLGGGRGVIRSTRDDQYDFEISNVGNEDDSKEGYSFHNSNRPEAKSLGRRSIEDRAKEILERNKGRGKSEDASENNTMSSYEATFKDLMEGITLPAEDLAPVPVVSAPGLEDPGLEDPESSAMLDSFEISAADLEVGALAAKRAKEKAAERKKRRSYEFPPAAALTTTSTTSSNSVNNNNNNNSTLNYSASSISPREDNKFSSSPEMMLPPSRARTAAREGLDLGQVNQRPAASIQLSTALSSINKNSDEYFNQIGGVGGSGEEILRYGSVERSDDDLYKMLNISDTERVATAVAADKVNLTSAGNKGTRSGQVRSSTMTTLSDGDSSYEGEGDSQKEMEMEKEKEDYSFDDFEQEMSPQKVTTTSPTTTLREKDREAEMKAPEKPIDPAEQVRLTQLEMIMKRWSQMEVTLTEEKPAAAAPPPVEDNQPSANLTEPDTVALSPQKSEDANDDTQGYADDYDKDDNEDDNESTHGADEVRATSDIAADTTTTTTTTATAVLVVAQQAAAPTPSNLEMHPMNETKKPIAALSDDDSYPASLLSLPRAPSKGNLTSSAGALRYQSGADDSHLSDSNLASVDTSAPAHWRDEKGPPPSHSNSNADRRLEPNPNPNPNLPSSSFQRRDRAMSDRPEVFSAEDDSLPVPPPPPPPGRPDLSTQPAQQQREDSRFNSTFHRPPPPTHGQINRDAPAHLPETTYPATHLDPDPNPPYLPYLPVPPEPEPLRYYSHRSLSQQEDDLTQQQQQQEEEEYSNRNSRGFTGRGLGAAAAAKIQQQRLAGKTDKSGLPQQKIKVITSNLHNIGTASSLGKQQRVLQRFQEEEFEKNRQDNLTLNRRLDRLGRETNDLKNSFVSLVGSNLAHPLESHVNLTHLQTMSALTDKALAVKVKEEELKIREEALSVRESQVQSKENFIFNHLRDMTKKEVREAELLKEVQALKATVFKLNQDGGGSGGGTSPSPATSRIPVRRIRKNLPYYRAQEPAGAAAGAGAGAGEGLGQGEPDVEMISVPRFEYEALVKEVGEQETLIAGFQLENEKLSQQLRLREDQENDRIARHYDAQEVLNKELNRLRNQSGNAYDDSNLVSPSSPPPYPLGGAAPGSHPLRRSLAENLRTELNKDAVIRDLQERLSVAEGCMGERERELRAQVEKLQQANMDLTRDLNVNANVHSSASHAIHTSERMAAGLSWQHGDEVAHLREEVSRLQHKVSWFASNQPLISHLRDQLTVARQSLRDLRDELAGTKDLALIRRIVSTTITKMAAPTTTTTTTPTTTTTTTPTTTNYYYNGEDVNDNSFVTVSSSSPTATKNSSGGGGRRSLADVKKIKLLEQQIQDLQESLLKRNPNSITAMLRANAVSTALEDKQRLEEELSRERDSFDQRLRGLRQQHEALKVQYETRLKQLEDRLREQQQEDDRVGGGRITTKAVKNIAQALARIRELEDEITKTKAAHQRKMEEAQRKHDTQIRALHQQLTNTREEGAAPLNARSADLTSGLNRVGEEETQKFYQERLGLLEAELMRTAEELGQVKRAQADATAKERADAVRLNDLSTANQRMEIQVRLAQDDLLSSREELRACKEELRARKEECERSSESVRRLKIELASVSARLLDTLQQPKTPSIAMFMNMETQLRQLEERLKRRDRDLTSAIDDGKATVRLETSRLQAMHAQELHEKDEQLRRFQNELQQLVHALRDWHKHQGRQSDRQGDKGMMIGELEEMILKY